MTGGGKCDGRTIIVTGASRGLGRALALRFASEGARLVLCARSEETLRATEKELTSGGHEVLARRCDVSNPDQVKAFRDDVLTAVGKVDGLVNNAALLGPRVPIVEQPPDAWRDVVQTNLHGTFYMVQAFLPGMMERGSGFIINVSSSVGRSGRKDWGAYAVTKFGVEGLTQVLAEEVRKFNIRVNAVNPGPIATDMRRAAYPEEDQTVIRTPDQITDVFVYLASNDGMGITGQSLDASTFVSNPGLL